MCSTRTRLFSGWFYINTLPDFIQKIRNPLKSRRVALNGGELKEDEYSYSLYWFV